jgi:hypothetical protein
MRANPGSLFRDCELRTYVLIRLRAENGLSTDALVAEIVKIKLTSFDASGSASFSPLVMRCPISLKTAWFRNSSEECMTVSIILSQILKAAVFDCNFCVIYSILNFLIMTKNVRVKCDGTLEP